MKDTPKYTSDSVMGGFNEAASYLCRRKARSVPNAYKSLKNIKQPTSNKFSKSYAQVESFVGQQVVGPTSGELKLEQSRPCKITARFTEAERKTVVRHAKTARLPISTYIRLTLLRLPGLDPERNKLLLKANFELTKQGTNLNQIAKHLNSGTASIDQGDSMLAIIARSLLSAHRSVREALSEGRSEP